MTDKKVKKFPTWIYPINGHPGKIVEMAKGEKAPAGYKFSPSKKREAKED